MGGNQELPRNLPLLEGPSLVLRRFRDSDTPLILEASADPFIPVLTTVPSKRDPDEALAYIDRQHGRLTSGEGYSFAIAERTSDEPVGQIGLWLRDFPRGRVSIGYWVVARHRRRGIAGEALQIISSWGVELPGVHRLELYVEPWNEGSWRAAERVGYQSEGLLRQWEPVGNEWKDMLMYALIRPWPSGGARSV
jgi:ribosomal-protein-alanine N-acetyltransferase